MIDQCWTGKPHRVISALNEVHGSSDHNLISVLVRTKDRLIATQEVVKRLWKDLSPEKFREEIGKNDWTQFFSTDNLDLMITIFEEEVEAALDRIIPMKCVQIRRNNQNWVDLETKSLMSQRDILRELARQSNSLEDWTAYRVCRNKTTKLLRRKKTEHFSTLYDSFKIKNDVKSIYRTAKSSIGRTDPGTPASFVWEGKYVRKPVELANILQIFFARKI